MVFAELEPFGPLANNLNSAGIASLIYNSNKKKGTKAKSVTDMALGDFKMEEEISLIDRLKQFAQSHNMGLKKGKKKHG